LQNSDDPDTETVVTPAVEAPAAAPVVEAPAAAPAAPAPVVAPVAPAAQVEPAAAAPAATPVAPVVAPAAAPATDDKDNEIAQLRAQIAQQAITTALADTKVGAREPAAVAALIDASKADTPEGIQAEITRVKTSYPGLFFGVGDINAGNRGGGTIETKPGFDRVKNAYKTNQATR
jgi:hypothetical protein